VDGVTVEVDVDVSLESQGLSRAHPGHRQEDEERTPAAASVSLSPPRKGDS